MTDEPEFSWDQRARAGYLYMNKEGKVEKTVELYPGVNADLDRYGNVLGIEVLL